MAPRRRAGEPNRLSREAIVKSDFGRAESDCRAADDIDLAGGSCAGRRTSLQLPLTNSRGIPSSLNVASLSERRKTALAGVPFLADLLLDWGAALGRRRLVLGIRTFRVEHAIDQMVESRLLAPMSSAIGIVGRGFIHFALLSMREPSPALRWRMAAVPEADTQQERPAVQIKSAGSRSNDGHEC
jgi:hypothetical protein